MSMPQHITAGQPPFAEFSVGNAAAETYPRPKKWTRKEYYQAAEAGAFVGQHLELIEGEILEKIREDGSLHGQQPVMPPPKRWTRKEYDLAVETGVFEGQHVQLIAGEIWEMSPQSYAHRQAIMLTLRKLQEVFKHGFMVCPQLPLAISDDSEPEPDFSVVPGDDPREGEHHPSHAVLIVEVSLSSLQFDRRRKAIHYAQAGIEDYWILNLQDRQLEVHRRPAAEGYEQIEIVPAEGAIAPLAAPEHPIEVRDLLP